MSQLCEQKYCTGCFVCADNCPQNAINRVSNRIGFSYPRIDATKCVDCGICTKHCHILSSVDKQYPMKLYSYKGTDEERLKSSSGAFFPLLAKTLLSKGYHICGVVFSEDFLSAKYVVTRDESTIERMRKSKYIAAELNSVFIEVKDLLDKGEKVLFIGLPCHVAGLLKTVHRNDNLITVDLLCFGMGSPWIYKESLLHFLKKKRHTVSELKLVDFRHKPFLYDSHTVIDIITANEKYTFKAEDFPYYNGYINALVFRESCYSCEYNSFDRISDITIGDTPLGHSDALGESIILLNTVRGCDIVEKLIDNRFKALSEDQVAETKNRFIVRKTPEKYYKIINCKDYKTVEKYLTQKAHTSIFVKKVKKVINRFAH